MWATLATEATAAARDGRPFVAPPDLDLPAYLLRPEASAMGSWVTAGHHSLHPVPACDYFADPTSDLDTGYFDGRVAAGDKDEAIADEVRRGLADDSTVTGTFMAWHHASFADFIDASAAAIVSDLKLGRFESLGSGVPTVPHRCVPHGCVDQSTPTKKKIRCITDHTYPFGRPSTNAGTDLSLYPDTHLSSGVAVGRQVGIVRAAGAGSVITKRDAVAAFRQVPICPSDYWKCGLAWSTGILIDVRLSFGSRIAVNKYQRVMLVCARHAMQEVAAFDASHPTTVASVACFLADRASTLGLDQSRLAALTQYIDDAHLASTADPVTPSSETVQGATVCRLRGGGSCQRGLAHGALLDDVYSQAGIIIDSGDKMVNTVNDGTRSDPPVEALGVEIDAAAASMSYPKAKVPRLRELIDSLVGEALTGTVSVGVMESTLGKEKWAAHVAVEINPLLSSTHATLHAALRVGSSGRGRVSGRQRSALTAPPARSLISDQRLIHAMADSLPSVPLVPASIFPPAASELAAHPFQDASEKYGMGGFFLDEAAQCFRYFITKWPTSPVDVGAALAARPRRWTIAAAELFAELVAVDAVVRYTEASFITNYTDNEVARAVANKGTTDAPALTPIVTALQSIVISSGKRLRTVRVTTKENSVSDGLSRGDLTPLHALAAAAGIPAVPFSAPRRMWSLLGALDTPIIPGL